MKPVEIEFLMKDGLSKGVDKSRAGVEQLLDASRRLGEVLSQSGEEGARASDKYNSKLVGLRQGVEKMSASLKAMGVSEKDTAGVLMKSSEQNVKFVEAQAGRLRSMEDALRSALESGNTALAETTKAEMEQVETWINEALNAIQKKAELIPTIVKNASSTVPDQQTESMRAQLRLLTNEIASTTVEYRRMTDAERNSAAGMELKQKLEDLIKKAGELRDAMDDANTQIRGEASDTKHLDGIAQGLSKGVDKSRAGVEQLLDASRRLGEVLSQSGEEGARASDKYNSKLVGLLQGVEKMSASLKAMGVSEKDTAGVLMRSSEQNVEFVEAQAGRLRSMEDALRSALESGNTALAETTKAEMEQVETWINEALNAIQKNAELIPTIVKNASSTVPDQQTESMRAQLRLLKNEIASTTVEYRRMTDAERNSAAGMELKRKLEEMKDGLSKGVDKSRAGIEQLLDASRRLGEVLSQSGEEGARASDKYNSKLVGLLQGVEKMSASLKAMGVSEKDTAGVLMKSSEQNVKFVEAQAGRLRSMEDALRSALESGNTALAETTKAEMEQVETWINEALNAIQKNAELIPTIVKNASSTVPDQQTESMRAQLRLLKNEIVSTTVEYRRMTDAERNSAAGMELERKLEDLIKKAGELRDAMDDANTQIRGEASDTKHLDGIAQGLNVVTSSAGAAVSVFQMFGASQEELINIQTKLQATLAISNALTVIQNNLQKESSLMMGIRTIQEKAHAAAISIRTAAEGRGIIVTKAATIAQAAFNAVANANPYVLLATAILTVVGALVAFTVGSKEATAAEKRQREEGERLRKQQEDMSHALGQAAGDVEAKYRSLQQQWNRLKTESEKNKWIKENANKFHELGLNVNSVADAEQVLVNMAPQVIAALKAVAEAEAYSDLYKQAIKERAEKWEHRVKSRATGDYYTTVKQGEKISDDEYRAAGLTAGDINYSTMYSPSAGISYTQNLGLTKSGVDKVNAYRREQARETNRQLQEGFNENVDFYAGKWEEAERKAAEAQSRIPAHLRYNGGGSNGGGNDLKDEEDRAEALTELQAKNRQAEIDQMAEGAEKKRAQLRLDYDKDIAELAELEKEWRTAQKGELTKEQTEALESARTLAKARLDAGEAEISKEDAEQERVRRRAEIQAMVEYLKEYGSYQQQKLAIAEEYAQKIADVEASEADEAWQKKKLNKERLQKEASLSFENISRGIDWHALFGGVGDLTKEMMAPMMEQLQAWVKTDEYRNADAETQQKVTELIQEMRKYVGTDQSVTWESLAEAIKDFTASVAAYDKAKKEEDAAVRARDEGKKKLDAGEITADEYKALEQRAQELGDATAQARENMEAFGNALNRTSEEVANFTSGLTTALSNAKGWAGAEGFGNIQNAVGGIDQLKGTLDSLLPQMGDGMAKTIGAQMSSTVGRGLGSIGKGVEGLLSSGLGSIVGIVAQIPKLILDLAGAVKNFVTGILDAVTELISLRWIDDLVVSILDAVGSLVDAIFDLPENLFKVLESIVVNGVGGLLDGVIGRIGNVLSLGALGTSVSSWFGGMDNHEEMVEVQREANMKLEVIADHVERIGSRLEKSYGTEAIRTADELREYIRSSQEEIHRGLMAAGDDRYGGRHSEWWHRNRNGGEGEGGMVARVKQAYSLDFEGTSWQGLFNYLASLEDGGGARILNDLRDRADLQDVWYELTRTNSYDEGAIGEWVKKWADSSADVEEAAESLMERLTSTTKENVFDDFLGSLYDLADGSEDVMDNIADNWQKMVNRMAVNNLVGAKFQKNLEEWYENLAKLNKARIGGEITDEEYRRRLDGLKAEYEGYVESAKRDIETLRTEGIVKATEENNGVTQSGKAGAFTTMSQDQAGKLEGLFVSGQMHWAGMDDKLTDVTRQMDEAGDHLRQIVTNTGSSAQSLGEIKEDIKKMIRDGLKMK